MTAEDAITTVQLSKHRRITIRLVPTAFQPASLAHPLNSVSFQLEFLQSQGWFPRFDFQFAVDRLGALIDALVEVEEAAVARGWLPPDSDGEPGW